jgi:hypothetical protein
VVATFAELLAKSAADEGRDIVLSMLVVGLIFIAVILIGDVGARLRRRKH